MAGKSTYMRQVALIVLMDQIGSFVPAKEANIGIVDRIFYPCGCSDDLASGQSTFMVEMNEVANILRNAHLPFPADSRRDRTGVPAPSTAWSIAWRWWSTSAIRNCWARKPLFATHYHELTELEGKLDGVNNYCIAVKENGDDIVFLRKIIPGGADKSYGIQVAKLAGLPDTVIERAKQIVEELSTNDIVETARKHRRPVRRQRGEKAGEAGRSGSGTDVLFDTVKNDDIIKELEELDITNITPMEALNKLDELQRAK